jgi:hypothetical protein
VTEDAVGTIAGDRRYRRATAANRRYRQSNTIRRYSQSYSKGQNIQLGL